RRSSDAGRAVFVGGGAGSPPPTLYALSASLPSTLLAADVDGDGTTDLLALNHDDNSVDVLLGNGNGNFQTPQREAVGLQPSALAVADFNGDGVPDLVTIDGGDPTSGSSANTIDTLTVVLGNGDGTFRSPSRFAVGTAPRGSTTADFTNTGVLDLAVADQGSGGVSILLGNGNGTFDPETLVPLPGQNTQPVAIVSADFNADGRFD